MLTFELVENFDPPTGLRKYLYPPCAIQIDLQKKSVRDLPIRAVFREDHDMRLMPIYAHD